MLFAILLQTAILAPFPKNFILNCLDALEYGFCGISAWDTCKVLGTVHFLEGSLLVFRFSATMPLPQRQQCGDLGNIVLFKHCYVTLSLRTVTLPPL